MKFYFLSTRFAVTVVFFCFFLIITQKVYSGDVEIVIDGKKYESIQDYRRQHVKDVLVSALSAGDLEMFTESELCEIIKEIRTSEISDTPDIEPDEYKGLQSVDQKYESSTEEEALDLNPSQMQDMLDSYFLEHKDLDPVLLDPDKVKSITIEPKSPIKEIPQN